MPGYRRPHTTAFAPGDLQGFDTLEKAFRVKQWSGPRLDKSQVLDVKRQSAPATYADIPSSEDGSAGSQTTEGGPKHGNTRGPDTETRKESAHQLVTPLHERSNGLMLRHTSGKVVTPPHLTRENSGLPPTPPTMADSDDVKPRTESLTSNLQFADAVRNALQTQKSGLSTPGPYLPTPDPSPPGTSDNLASSSLQRTHLHPVGAHHLRQYPSSRADSYHTAREAPTPSASQLHLPHTPSPELQSSSFWTDSIRGLHSGAAGVGLASVQETPPSSYERFCQDQASAASETSGRSSTPTPVHRLTQRPRSPYQAVASDSDFDKHISYISDRSFEQQASAEDVNNLVYLQIQAENVKRHSAISNDNEVPAGIWFLEQPMKDHRLRRTAKAQSLRKVSGSDNDSQIASMDSSARKQLRHKKAMIPSRSLESSPTVEPNTNARRTSRQPAGDGERSSINRLTMEAIEDMIRENEASMERERRGCLDTSDYSRQPIAGRHTLRHSPKTERLVSHTTPSERGSKIVSPTLRHVSAPLPPLNHFPGLARFEDDDHVERMNVARPPKQHTPLRSPERTLRHFSAEKKLENNHHVRHTSLDATNNLRPSSPRKSLDARFLHPSTTPVSTSQFSDRSEAEVCEAKGINIYPHNNHSLLLVQHGSSAVSKDIPALSPTNHLRLTNDQLGFGLPLFTAHVQEPSPILASAKPAIHVDSPLTNPRAAPEPPAFKVIPPTPNEELDRQLAAPEDDERQDERPSPPQRRLSLKQRARRFSESFIEQPLFGRSLSLRKQPKRASDDNEVRPTHLSPLWRPTYLWDGYDSEDEYDDMELDGMSTSARLPQGGDTSDFEEREQERKRKRRGVLPRNMSVRMPGFRGQGGFLLGNSLGLDRHGTNNRRHYVVKKESMGGMSGTRGGYVGELRKRGSEEMSRQMVGGRGTFTLPFSGGRTVQYVGFERFRQRLEERRGEKEERVRERRREALRGQIQRAK
ncbi:hypothetical protein LTR36_005689 [Oleoguttula mirabilis]|uniref:Uncharacterized protein n=1 Tax=Oleoguttula mirabilis TaxID=1507867 RepID=A0AAV9JDZ6_9PEZI|nr:hypothetical protein LTR36_005689 [Oleoguttula mirabilis]